MPTFAMGAGAAPDGPAGVSPSQSGAPGGVAGMLSQALSQFGSGGGLPGVGGLLTSQYGTASGSPWSSPMADPSVDLGKRSNWRVYFGPSGKTDSKGQMVNNILTINQAYAIPSH